jgi:hypothetical protein
MKYHRFTEKEVSFLKQNYETKGSEYCSNKLGIDVGKIISKTSRMGLKINEKTKSSICSKTRKVVLSNRKNEDLNVNPEKFITLNDPYSIYLLGLIWSDGHVTFANNKAKTPLIKHTSIVEDSNDFLPIFMETGNWKNFIFENKKLNYKPIRVIHTSNRILGEWLILNGYRNKNKYPLFLDKIPKDFLHYFFRGLYDGDGYIENNVKSDKYIKKHVRCTLTSGCNQDWGFIISIFNELGLDYRIRNQKNVKGCTSHISLNTKESIIWCEYIYGGLDFGLYRKKQKWVDVININQSLLISTQ